MLALVVFVFASVMSTLSQAQTAVGSSVVTPIKSKPGQGKEKTFPGARADSRAEDVLAARPALNPIYGAHDVFIASKGEVFLDMQDIGPVDDLYFDVFPPGLVDGGKVDDKTIRLRSIAGEGSSQILWYRRDPVSKEKTGALLKVHNIFVTAENLMATVQELKSLIGNIEGIQIRVVGDRVVLDGKVVIPSDLNRIQAAIANYNNVVNLVDVSPRTLELLASKMEETIAGGPDRRSDIRVRVVNGVFFLEGWVDKNSERLAAMEICRSMVPMRYVFPGPAQTPIEKRECINLMKVRAGSPSAPDPVMSVRVDFVTLDRSYLKNFSFNWNPGISDGVGEDVSKIQYSSDVGRFLTTFTATLSNLFPKLKTASDHGYGRILKTATLLVKDGSGGAPTPAKLNEKIVIPFRTESVDANGVRQFGFGQSNVVTSISIQAQSAGGQDNKVNLSIDAKTTEITGRPFGDTGPPITSENSVNTSLVVSSGESAALGGLISDRRSVSFSRTPTSSSDFSVVNFNRTQNFSDGKSQFVIFVTPQRLRSTGEGTDTLKRKFRLRK